MPLFQALERLQASIASNDTPEPLPTKQEVFLPQLRNACLTFEDYDILAYTFSVLTTPTLVVLCAFGSLRERAHVPGFPPLTDRLHTVDLPHWPVDEFSGWLKRSGHKLKDLTLEKFTMPQWSLVNTLELLPELASLSLNLDTVFETSERTSAIDDDILLRMTARDGELPSLLPQLTELCIWGIGPSNETLSIAMIKSRRDPPFEEVYINTTSWKRIFMVQGEVVVKGWC
ncbi:hypothetical protein EV122DRAFT_273762 [Schizophyllum commune]